MSSQVAEILKRVFGQFNCEDDSMSFKEDGHDLDIIKIGLHLSAEQMGMIDAICDLLADGFRDGGTSTISRQRIEQASLSFKSVGDVLREIAACPMIFTYKDWMLSANLIDVDTIAGRNESKYIVRVNLLRALTAAKII
jgi:hypothetical protein